MNITLTRSAARRRFDERREEAISGTPDHILRRWVIAVDLAIVGVVAAGVAGWL